MNPKRRKTKTRAPAGTNTPRKPTGGSCKPSFEEVCRQRSGKAEKGFSFNLLNILETIRSGGALSPFAQVDLTAEEVRQCYPRLWQRAFALFGNAQRALQWFETPLAKFHGKTPLEVAITTQGKQALDAELKRLERFRLSEQ